MSSSAIVGLAHRKSIPGTPGEYDESSLDVIEDMLKETLDPLGGIKSFVKAGDKVLLKPNVVAATRPEYALTTDPRVLHSLCNIIFDGVPNVGEVGIGESCAAPGKTRVAFEEAGITEVCKKLGIREYYFDEVERARVEIPDGVFLKSAMLPKPLLDADVYINVPKLKSHPFEFLTGCIKNQHGLLSQEDMLKHHRDDGHQKFVDIYKGIQPHLNVIDGIYAMQVTNASNDRDHILTDMNIILAGQDAVAVDAIASHVMGLSPSEVPVIRIASMLKLGIADLDRITVVGTPIEKVVRRFERPPIFADAIDPDVRTYIGGACIGCKVTVIQGLVNFHGALEGRSTFLPQIKRETFRKLFGHLTIISGMSAPVPEEPDNGLVIVAGECAREHKDKGIFVPGCWDVEGNAVTDLHSEMSSGIMTQGCKKIAKVGDAPFIWDLDNLPLIVRDQLEKKLRVLS